MKLVNIIKKDIKLLLRSKISSLIVIFGPLLIMFLVGTAFDNSNEYAVKISTYSDTYSELTDSFLQKLNDKKYVVAKETSNETCVEKIRQGQSHACIVFPGSLKIEDGKTNEVAFYVDYSKINLVWNILDTVSSGLTARSDEISFDLTKELMDRLERTKTSLATHSDEVDKMIDAQSSVEELADRINRDVERIRIDLNSIDPQEYKQQNDKMASSAYSFANDTTARLKDVNRNLEDARRRVKSFYTGEEQQDETYKRAVRYIDLAKGDLEGLEFNLLKSLNETTETYNQVNEFINSFTNRMTQINFELSKLEKNGPQAKETIAAIGTSLQTAKETATTLLQDLGSIAVTDAKNIAQPISTRIKPVTTEATHLNYVFSGLLVLVIMFISMLLATTLVMMEKTSPSYFRNFITPTHNALFVASSFATSLLIMVVQLAIIVVVSGLFFSSQVWWNLHITLFLLLLLTSFFILLGMFVGYTFNSQETAMLGSISLGSLMLMLSNTILPIESMPDYIRQLAQFNPFVLGESMLRRSLLFSAGVVELWPEMLIIFGYCVVLCVFILLSQRLLKEEFFRTKKRPSVKTANNELLHAAKLLNQKDMIGARRAYIRAQGIYHEIYKNRKDKEIKKLYARLKKFEEKLQ